MADKLKIDYSLFTGQKNYPGKRQKTQEFKRWISDYYKGKALDSQGNKVGFTEEQRNLFREQERERFARTPKRIRKARMKKILTRQATEEGKELRAKQYRERQLKKSPITLTEAQALKNLRIGVKYQKAINDLIIDHGGTRPSTEVIGVELKSRLGDDKAFMNLWTDVQGNKPFTLKNLQPSSFKRSIERGLQKTKSVTSDNYKKAIQTMLVEELGSEDAVQRFKDNDFRLDETIKAGETRTKGATYQYTYKNLMKKGLIGWGSKEARGAWTGDPGNKATKLNRELGISTNADLRFDRSHFFPVIQAKKLHDLKLLSKEANDNFKERFTYKPGMVNKLQAKTYDEDIKRALRNFTQHKDKNKLSDAFKIAALKAKNVLGLDVDELVLNKEGTFDFVPVKRKLQSSGSLGTKAPMIVNSMRELSAVNKMVPGSIGENQYNRIVKAYPGNSQTILGYAKKLEDLSYPETRTVEGVQKPLTSLERFRGESSPYVVNAEVYNNLNKSDRNLLDREMNCKDGCFVPYSKQHPGKLKQLMNKIPKGGRLGMLLGAVTGAGAVGLGSWSMMGGAKAQEPRITDQMSYNATEGKFVKPDGDPESQEGILNWIADHPIYSGLAPVPVGIGAGLGADAMNAKNVGNFFKSMKFMLPPAYAAEKLYQYKEGQDLGEMFTNPLDAVWAMAIDSPASAKAKLAYYTGKAAERAGTAIGPVTRAATEAQQLGLHPRTWKNIGKATMAPASRGTRLVFPFGTEKYGFGAAKPLATKGLARAAGIGARMLPLGPIPMALLAGSMAWDKYKFNKEIGNVIDAMRARGVVNEEDAQTMQTIYKQGWLGTTALGAKLLGSEELMFEGEMLDLDAQKRVLAGFKEHYEDREKTGKEFRAGERQEDFFSWFSGGGRVGLAEGGNKKPFGSMTRRGFLKWLVGSIAVGVAAVSGRGLKQAAKTITPTVAKAVPTKFAGVEGMPIWFPRAVAKIKAHGKLIEMADKHYVGGDVYEMMIPVQRTYSYNMGPLNARKKHTEVRTELEKVTMEENPLTGEISMHWTGTDNFGDDAVRSIEFKPGEAGYQKFGVDDPDAAAQGMTEFQRVKVTEPEFNYIQPDQSNPYRDDIEYLDIFEEGDEIVKGLEDMTGGKNMVTKDGTVIDVSAEGKGVDEAFKKKIYHDIEGEGQIIPEPENAGVDHLGNVYGEEQYLEIIEGTIPDHLKKKASGGIIETGNIARRPGAVPPLSGPNPQGSGIVGLFSNPKQVNVGS